MLEETVRAQLSKACDSRLCLEIYYAKGSGERKRYELVPVSIRRKGDSSMLYGYDLAESKNKAFRIDRILQVELMSRKPWPDNIRERVGYPLELETSKEAVPRESGIKLRPASSQ